MGNERPDEVAQHIYAENLPISKEKFIRAVLFSSKIYMFIITYFIYFFLLLIFFTIFVLKLYLLFVFDVLIKRALYILIVIVDKSWGTIVRQVKFTGEQISAP